MTSARWNLVVRIFEEALEKPPGERFASVHTACDGDQGLEAEVLKLLAADEQAGSFLERPVLSSQLMSNCSSPSALLAPSTVVSDRFEILSFLGQGGMGQVYEAFDLELKDKVALKAIHPGIASDPRMLARFRREVQLTRRITHPNVCRTFDIDRHSSHGVSGDSDITFLTMELLAGETLSDLLRRQGRLSTDEALPLVLQMIEALSAAHAVGVIHRDFKPSNVLLVPSNNGLRVVVTDFGLARAILPDSQVSAEQMATSLTGGQGLMGTLVYMAPEQFERGETSVASDVYALGLVMYEVVTGQRPFADAIPFAEAVKRLKHAAPSPKTFVPELEPAWEEAIERCLEGEPGLRFARVQDIPHLIQDGAVSSFAEADVVGRQTSRRGDWRKVLGLFANKRYLAFSVAIAILLSLSIGLVRLNKWRAEDSHLQVGSKVLVTDIYNESHDLDLNGVTELLRSQLSQSAYMNLMDQKRVVEALGRMSRPKDTALVPELARDVAWREGVPLVLFGTISRVAEDYRLDLKAEKIGNDPSYPKRSWRFSETAASKRDLLETVQHGSEWVRRLVGESDNEIENTDRRPEDVTTSSWEALKLYSEGQHFASLDKLDEAALLFKRAAEKDPEFAMAWMRLGDTLDTIGKANEGFVYWRKALVVSGDHRLSPREELRIKGMYASDTGDLKAAVDYFSQYSIAYPNDYLGYFDRGFPLMLLGRAEEAIQVLQEAEKRAPESYYIADHLARYNLILGNFTEVSQYTARVRQLGHSGWADEVDGQARAAKGDYDRAGTLFEGLAKAEDPFLRSVRFYLQACILAEQGHYDEAIEVLDDGQKQDLPLGEASNRADKLLGMAYLYFKKADRVAGREAALKSVQAEPSVRRTADVGTLLARANFVGDARRLLRGLHPDDATVANRVALLRLRGEILLAQGQCQAALGELQRAKAQDQEQAMLRDYWGHALLACGRKDEAMDEFDKMRSRPGQVWHQAETYMPGWNEYLALNHRSTSQRAQN